MKNLLLVIALFGLVGSVLLSGCKKDDAPPAVPTVPSTNAPAQ